MGSDCVTGISYKFFRWVFHNDLCILRSLLEKAFAAFCIDLLSAFNKIICILYLYTIIYHLYTWHI